MREGLPQGTVTFLFTDIVGSTRLLGELGEAAYAASLAEHRGLIREATAANGGVEVDTQGDAFFIAFPSADAAAAAALTSRDGLASTRIRARMGLHTGTPFVTDEGYVGADVHLAARIAATAHGGQIVLSDATCRALGPDTPTMDLGEHRLKDIDRPVAIHQLGEGSFPPLRSIANTNLPTPISSFLGRSDEVTAIRARIEGGARLVTMTGPGGTGKTRLSLEVARGLAETFPAGVTWVGLSSIHDASLVLPTIASVLGTTDDLATHIGRRRMLLVIDNMEQVAAAGPELAHLLGVCGGLVILVTSRITLRITGETQVRVGPLDPDDAIALFLDRSGLDPSPDVEELCRRLDAMPLALELAASRARVLGPRAILDRLGSRLDLLKGGRDLDPRQQTLRATIAWSDELLDERERRLFRRLSVFPGGASLEAAEAVLDADVDVLEALVDHSLVRSSHGRFWMLETIRVFALDGFETMPDRAAVEGAFTAWALDLVEREDGLVRGPHQVEALARLDVEIDNIRRAAELLAAGPDPDAHLRMALRSHWWLDRRGFHAESDSWLEAASERRGGDPALIAEALIELAPIVGDAAAVERSQAMLGRAQALAESAGDEVVQGRALEMLGYMEPGPSGLAKMRQAAAIFERLGRADEHGRVTIDIGARSLNEGDDELAVAESRAARRIAGQLGNQHGIAVALMNQAAGCALLGRYVESDALLREAVVALDSIGDASGVVWLLEVAAVTLAGTGRLVEAAVVLAAHARGLAATGIGREPSDDRLLAAAEARLADLAPEVRAAAQAEGSALLPRDALERWLRATADQLPR